jgi:A/G-specific adenine glycosylase
LRLHQAATAIRDRHDGEVPDDHAALLALPGVGSYTAAAIASFAFGRRHVVLDTNVRRVQARIAAGVQFPAAATTAAERLLAEEFLPDDPGRAARWAVASMELGALICTARNPRCDDCPVRDECSWRERGCPVWDGPPRVGQRYDGTDRQCRGALLAVLRSSDVAVPGDELLAVWRDPAQARRAIDTLTADGLMISVGDDAYALPH